MNSIKPVMLDGMETFRGVFIDSTNSPIQTIRPEGLPIIEGAGFGKIGFAFMIENPMGNLFLCEHETASKNNVQNHETGVNSETPFGLLDDESEITQIESVESCLVRCLSEEQGVDLRDAPEKAELFISRISPFVVIDWSMEHDKTQGGIVKNTFAYVIALRSNIEMYKFIELNAKNTPEARAGSFRPLPDVQRSYSKGDPFRASFGKLLLTYLLFNPQADQTKWEKIGIPEALDSDKGTWRDLCFSTLQDLNLNSAV